MVMKSSLRAVVAMAMLTLLVAVTACTNKSDNQLEYGKAAMLNGADIGADDLSGVKLIGDIALVATTKFSGGRLAAIDLKSGRTIWSADDGDPILGGESAVVDLRSPHDPAKPVVRDLGKGKFEVLVPYRTAAHIDGAADEPVSLGVASLSGADGRAVWLSEPLISAEERADNLMARPVLASADTVVAASAQRGRPGSLTTWAIDGKSGSTRWTKDGVWPSALSAATVVVEHSSNADLMYQEEGPEWKRNTAPIGIDAQKGKQVWDLADRFDSARVQAAAGNYAVVHADGGYGASGSASDGSSAGSSTELIEIDAGSTAEGLDDFAECTASSTTIACAEDGQLSVIDASDGNIERSSPYGSDAASYDWEIVDVFGDTVIAKDETGDNDRLQALDRSGKVRAEELAGSPHAMNEDYLVVCTEERTTTRKQAKCGIHAADSDANPDRSTANNVQPLSLSDPLPSSLAESTGFRTLDIREVTGVALADDSVIIAGYENGYDDYVVAAVEADTADPIWTLDQSTKLTTGTGQNVAPVFRASGKPSVINTSDGFSLLMAAKSGGRSGVASVDGATGDLESFHPVSSEDDYLDLHVGNGAYAAIEASDTDSQRTVLVDYSAPTKPKSMWTQDGVAPAAIGEDSVAVQKASESEADREFEDVQVLDLDTGKDVIWDSTEVREGERPGTVMLEAGLLIVNWSDGTEVVDADSGTSLDMTGKRLSQCTVEGATVMCDSTPNPDTHRNGSPITLERTNSGVDIAEVRNRFINGISGAYDGRFFVDAEVNAISIDSRGTQIDSDLTGRFVDASDEGYALFMTCHPRVCVSYPTWDIRRVD